MPHVTISPQRHTFVDSLLALLTDMLRDGLHFFSLTVRSQSALSAEILFLRKQLGFYEERQVPVVRKNSVHILV
jgi:hypothetical protein